MVELNKDERVWVCFEMARVQNAHEDCGPIVGLAEEFLPSMRYSRRKEKYTQHGTNLNRNEVNNGRYLWFLVILLSKKTLRRLRSDLLNPKFGSQKSALL